MIEGEPKDAEAYRRRVYIYRAMKQNDKAIADLQTILKLKPKDQDAQEQSGRARECQGLVRRKCLTPEHC